ncbi:MAG TPA: ABC transporter permease [Vicinamibacterales bacterium]|nr:ABC transporter permease [Vicinamibacterales bacterium]
MFDSFRQDITHAVRGLIKSPGFAAASLITLALGIGATSAIFSVVKAVLMTPLPYAAPERTVQIFTRWTAFEKTWIADQEVIDFRSNSKTMTAIASWNSGQQNLTGDGEPIRIGVGFVTANLFDVLGVRPLLGRVMTAEEDVPNGAQVAVLGYPIWQSRYGGDANVIGKTLLINDVPVQVIGVMPEGFRLPTDFNDDAAEPTQLWRPMAWDLTQLSRSHGYFAAATLAPGQTAASATEELRAITKRLTEQGAYPVQMQFSAFAVPIEDEIRGGIKPAMWLLMGAVGFLLLIACANVANLLLVRGDARLREMAVRTAIGAAPDRLVRQLLTESIVLALLGALLGLALASIGLRVLMTVDPTSLPPLAPVRLDWTVVSFTLLLGVITTIVFGLAPALRTLRVNLVESLREGGQATVGGHRQRLRGLLVVAEVTLAVVLVIGAALMVKSLSALGRIDLGFKTDHMLTMRVSVPTGRYDTPEKTIDFYRQLNEKVRALPGVQSAGFVRVLPLATTIGDYGLDVEGFEESPGRNAKGDWQIVTDGSFEAMGARLLRGRWFNAADTSGSAPVAVINETMARTYWKNPEDAIGGHIKVGGGDPKRPWVNVVGMVADERHNGVTGIVKEKFYIPHSQWHIATNGSVIRGGFLVVRTAGDPMAIAASVRSQVRALDPNIPVANIRPMTEVVAASLATPRLTGFLMGTFAAIALTLAAVGIYGVLSYLVARRTHEIGIRLAVGADRMQVLTMILKQGLTLAGTGIVAGIVAALALTRLMQTLLYQVRPSDPETFILVSLALVGVAIVASAVPAYRATRVSPLVALRTE